MAQEVGSDRINSRTKLSVVPPKKTHDRKLKQLKIIFSHSLFSIINSALKVGGTSALDSLLDHPAASFAIAALEDWQQTKDN